LQKIPEKNILFIISKVLGYFISILSVPFGTSIDINLLLLPDTIKRNLQDKREKKDKKEEMIYSIKLDITDVDEFMKMRIDGCKAIGNIFFQKKQF
jgi:hypothetical protein